MADDDDVRGAPGPEELFAPTGPRRSSFTPAPDDAETREAAANLFNDDAIAAALSAELARVASGPIPIQRPPVEQPEPVEDSVAPVEPPSVAAPQPQAPGVAPEQTAVAESEPVPEPISAGETPPPAQPGPPAWAASLFGEPQPDPVQPPVGADPFAPGDPFAPSAPSFAPSSGPFPPPGDSPPEPAPTAFPSVDADASELQGADPDALRALYAAAPAPTVPAADAPPPPGYATPGARRRALDDDESPTRSAIEELQAQLDQRDREAREYAAWESSMLEVGTPESLAAVEEARAERAGMQPAVPVASAPLPVEEPVAFLPPPAEEPAVFLPPPAEEPAVFLPPPVEEPADEPVADYAPPADEPAAELPPPSDEPIASAPPAVDNPFDVFAASIDHEAENVPPPSDASTPFPGFAPPTDASPIDFAAPADPRELSFDPPPVADAPVFLEPAPAPSAPSAPPGPPSWNLDDAPPESAAPEASVVEPTPEERAAAQPTDEERADAGGLPALVEPPAPDGLAELWRTAAQSESSAPAADPAPELASPPTLEPTPAPAPAPEGAVSRSSADAPPAPPPMTEVAHGFDDLLSGSAKPEPQPPSSAWVAGEPNPFTEPAIDAATGDRRPFGEGVDRDEAVDPSDSIFGAPPAPVSVDTAGLAVAPVAVAPDYVVVDSPPSSALSPATPAEPVVLIAPKISPAERVGLEPTPIEQRVGRAARLFWLWFAANSSIAAIVFGTIIFALGVSLRQAIVATLAGVALSFLPLGLGTLAGKRSGQPTLVISRATFGVAGNILPSLIALFSRLFWAAGLLWVLGAGTADILTGAQLTDGFTTGQLTIIAMGIGFVLAVVLAYFGYGLIAKVQLVVSVISGLTIVGFVALTFQYVSVTTALSTPDGPWILVVSGAVLVFSFVGLAWANSSSDVARYQRPGSSGAASVLWASFGVALPSFILIAYGALLAASNDTLAANIAADPLDSLGRLLPVWYPAPLLAATVLSLLSGVILALYSGGFALQAAGLRLRRSLSTLIAGVLMLLIAIIISNALTDFSQLFRDLATTVAVPVAAWAGIFGAEIMIRKRRFDAHSLLNRGGVYADVRWVNLTALVVISAVGYGFLSATMSGLSWEGYLFTALGIPLQSQLATSDFGVLVALALGLLVPLVAGNPGIRAQEKATRVPE